MISPIELEKILRSIFPKAALTDRNRIAMHSSFLLATMPDAPLIPLLKRVAASYLRHTRTSYDAYLLSLSKEEARAKVYPLVTDMIHIWMGTKKNT